MGIAFTDANLSMMLFQPRVRVFCVLCEKRSFTETAKLLAWIFHTNLKKPGRLQY